MKEEIRYCTAQLRAVRDAQEDDLFQLEGTAASYNTLSGDLGGFRERIAPGAFARSIREENIACLFNHNYEHVLGRVKSGTLNLFDTDKGLAFRCKLDPNNSVHQNVHAMVKRGDIAQCSFGFSVPEGGDDWDEALDDRGKKFIRRTLKEVNLREISAVAFPAYDAPGSTSVDARFVSDAAVDAYNKHRCYEIGQEIESDFERRIAAAHEAVRDSALKDLGIKLKGDK